MQFYNKLKNRADGISDWLKVNHPEVAKESKYLDEGSAERAYWHSGYAVAIYDIMRLLDSGLPNITDLPTFEIKLLREKMSKRIRPMRKRPHVRPGRGYSYRFFTLRRGSVSSVSEISNFAVSNRSQLPKPSQRRTKTTSIEVAIIPLARYKELIKKEKNLDLSLYKEKNQDLI